MNALGGARKRLITRQARLILAQPRRYIHATSSAATQPPKPSILIKSILGSLLMGLYRNELEVQI